MWLVLVLIPPLSTVYGVTLPLYPLRCVAYGV